MRSAHEEGADYVQAHSYAGQSFFARLAGAELVTDRLTVYERKLHAAPCITTADGASARTVSYGEFGRLTRSFAAWLATDLHLAAGDAVAIVARNDLASIVAVTGAIRLGVPVLMLSPTDPPARREEQRKSLGASIVLQPADVSGGSEAVALPDLERLPSPRSSLPTLDPAADALYFGTSGSTAASKLVAQSHYAVAVNALAVRRHHRIRQGDRSLGCLPMHHVNCLHFSVLGSLAAGAHLVLAARFVPSELGALIEQHRPRVTSIVPTIAETLLTTWRSPNVPRTLSHVVSAAAALSAETAEAFFRRFGVRIAQGYGLTETVNFSTTMPLDLADDAYARLMFGEPIPPVGHALFGNEVAVLRDDLSPAREREVGEVCVRGHNVMTRYVGNAEATAAAFRGGWFHTGDVGFWFRDEAAPQPFIVLTGRQKNIAKVGGETVSLDEVDRRLRALPYVHDAASSAVADRVAGERVAAAVVLAREANDARIRADLAVHLPAVAVPRRIVRVDAVPRSPTGKVLRPQLRDLLDRVERGDGSVSEDG